jgi:Secretion system C-terminal sorting domain
MKKNLTLLFVLMTLISLNTTQAQLPAGSLCPDFTVTDINGNRFNLYSTLDSGKTVIIDVMATWCAPCWGFHGTHVLADLYAQRGPGTAANDVRILMVEGDARTTLANLRGTSTGTGANLTQGNWTTGTYYPIIDSLDGSNLARTLQIGYFPTLYIICPNRKISESAGRTAANFTAGIAACPTAVATPNASIFAYTGYKAPFCQTKTFAPTMQLQNMGRPNMTSASIQLKLNGTVAETKAWTGNLATYGVETVTFNSITASNTNANLAFDIINVNGAADATAADNHLDQAIPIGPVTGYDTLFVEVKTDFDNAETAWQLQNDQGVVLKQGGNPNVVAGRGTYPVANAGRYLLTFTTYWDTVVVPTNACYKFRVYDEYGDGMHNTNSGAGTAGYYNVYRGSRASAGYIMLTGGGAADYTDISNPFEKKKTGVSVGEISGLDGFRLFPNPASENVHIEFNLDQSMVLDVSMVNTLGQTVATGANTVFNNGQNQIDLPVSDLTNGVYFVVIKSSTASIMKKVVVNK